MKFKYNVGSYGSSNIVVRSNASNVWKAISNSWPVVERNISWMIKDGTNTRFQGDSQQALDDIPAEELNLPVAFYAYDEGWNSQRFDHLIPKDAEEKKRNA